MVRQSVVARGLALAGLSVVALGFAPPLAAAPRQTALLSSLLVEQATVYIAEDAERNTVALDFWASDHGIQRRELAVVAPEEGC